jgi:phage terminase large subunit GpA-like protein
MTMLANPERMAQDAIALVLEPPPPVDYGKWAEENVVFSKRESPEPGPYNRERFSYFDEILKALSPDDPCRIVTLKKSAQLGGTVLANVFVGGSMDMDPGDVMYVHPTENNAQRWSKMKLSPMLKGTTALREIFPQKSRDGSDSVMYKERVDGLGAILISGANSPATLSQVTVPRQVQDDLSKWEMNAAGDPEAQADSRSRAIEFAKIFKISTPLIEPGCRISKDYDDGSQESLYVPCPHCEFMQTLDWANMLANLDEEHPEDAHFNCVSCGEDIHEHHRSWMLERKEWRAARPHMKKIHRSFYIWSAYSHLQSWKRIALEWLNAKGDPAAEQTFLNDTVGLAFKAQGEAPPWEGLRDRAIASTYARGEIPPGALLICYGMDCQADRVEWQLVGFGRDGRRWVIQYGVVPGHISETRTREQLDGLVAQEWPNSFGRKLKADMAAIDGNAWTEDVWGWAKGHPANKVIMVRGRGEEWAPLLARVKRERNRSGALLKYSSRFYNFGTSVLKMALYRNLAKADPKVFGFVGFPRGLDDEYFRQLTSERRTPQKRFGFTVYRWTKDPNQANEGLDTMLQAEAAAIKLGLRGMPDAVWDHYENEREVEPAMVDGPAEPLAAQTQSKPQPASTPARPIAAASDPYI